MLQFIIKTSKIGFWFLLPLFLISNAGVVYKTPVHTSVEKGNYRLKTHGSFDNILVGHVVFTEKVDSLGEKKQLTKLEFKLGHIEKTLEHSMGFVISKHISESGSLVGRYDVKAKAAGFSNNVDGVFGFADISILGEMPFFTDYGTVYITDIADGTLHADLDITFRNFEGRSIDISGSFIAIKSR